MTRSITRSIENLHVRPLFYDVISGEFDPHTDPEGKYHTLGHLAIETYQSGERIQSGLLSNLYVYEYSPQWAPDILSEISLIENRSHVLLENITISATNRRRTTELSVVDSFEEEDRKSGIVLTTIGGRLQIYPGDKLLLSLGEDLDDAKKYVTNEVRIFFDNLRD